MICNNCGNEILEEFGTCPYCKTPIGQNQNSNNKQDYRNNRYIYNKRKQNDTTATTVICIIIAVVSLTLFIILIKNNSIENIILTKDNLQETMDNYSKMKKDSDDIVYVVYALLYYTTIDYMYNIFNLDAAEENAYMRVYGKTIKELKNEGKSLMEENNVTVKQFKESLKYYNFWKGIYEKI